MTKNKMMTKKTARILSQYENDFNIAWAGCSEPGYDDKPVIMANWNNSPAETFDYLEERGFSCKWEGEWITCECGKAFRTSPDSYGWRFYGVILDGYCLCGDCIKESPVDYLESLENNPHKYSTIDGIDYESAGYTRIEDGFESGFHPGQNANPESILKLHLDKNPRGRYIFVLDGTGQFDIEFSLYKKNEESES